MSHVGLVGDFNNWDPRTHPLHTEEGSYWATTIARPSPGFYGFHVTCADGRRLIVCDPYAQRVHWDRHGARGWLDSEPPHTWQHVDYRTPRLRDLILYEILVRDFTPAGTFDGARRQLDHLSKLGVNAIELMPVMQAATGSTWGYNPVFYHSPHQDYGSPNALKRLIDEAHGRGLAVILDIALNHAWADHPYYQIYPPLFAPNGRALPDKNPFFHHTVASDNSWGGIDWDHWSSYTTAYMQDIVRHWLREYRVDGFRFDWACGIDFDPVEPQRPFFDSFHGISAIAWAARDEKPDVILIAEYWPIPEAHPAKNAVKLVHDTPIDAVWNDDFCHPLSRALRQEWAWEQEDLRRALGGLRQRGFTSADQAINYTASHDEVRAAYEVKNHRHPFISVHPSLRHHYPNPAAVARRKELLGLAALMLAVGTPMLWQGQEWADDAPRTIGRHLIKWGLLEEPEHQLVFQACQRLIRLRHDHPALRSDHVEWYFEDDFPKYKVLRLKRWDKGGDVVIAALNFDCIAHQVGLGFADNGPWVEALTGVTIDVQGNWKDVWVPEWGAMVFVRG